MSIHTETLINWVVNPALQNSENMASRSHETRRIPDPYIFIVKDGKIRSPSNNQPVEDQILRRDTYEELEFQAFLKIQDWVNENDSGTILWFSPPFDEGYTALKAVSTEIIFLMGQKILFNRAVVIDGVDGEESIKIANFLSSEKFFDTETLRYSPIPIDAEKEEEWLNILSIYTPQAEMIRSSSDIGLKVQTLEKTQKIIFTSLMIAERQAREMDLIGDKPDSCQRDGQRSGFDTMFDRTLGENFFPCPRCGGRIQSGLGITECPHCHLTKEEAGSTCG